MTITPFADPRPAGHMRFLALARHYVEAAAEIRTRGLLAAMELTAGMGGVQNRAALARKFVALAQKEGPIPRCRIERRRRRRLEALVEVEEHLVMLPRLTWRWQDHIQHAVLEWWPMHCVTVPVNPADRVRLPLPA